MTTGRSSGSEDSLVARGVYTLADDGMIEWFQAFIRSFRKANPTLPLTVIPFNRNLSRVQMLQRQFDFDFMDNSICERYDGLSDKVAGKPASRGCFRKFACFLGKYHEFLFLDVDIVTLMPVDRLFDALSGSSSQFVYSDRSMEMCYAEALAPVMVAQYDSPAYNSGFFLSRHGVLTEDQIFAAAEKAAGICAGFAPGLGEQPFINYVTDVSRIRYISIDALVPDFAERIWARQALTYDWKDDTASNAEGKLVPFIHWAGCKYPTMVRPEIFLHYRFLGLSFPAQAGGRALFYFRRWRVNLSKRIVRWRQIFVKFGSSKAWRKFYLCKLMGIKIKVPL